MTDKEGYTEDEDEESRLLRKGGKKGAKRGIR